MKTVIFDLGGVLIDYDPRYLYRKLLETEAEVEHFLANVCTREWNELQDAGRTIAEATAERIALFPEHADLIRAFYERWTETMNGAVEGTVDVLRDVAAKNEPVYALTNFSAETFPVARTIFEFLDWFEDVLVSGEEKLIKPDPKIFDLALERFGVNPKDTIFIDDRLDNVAAAENAGMQGLHFTTAGQLRADLQRVGVL